MLQSPNFVYHIEKGVAAPAPEERCRSRHTRWLHASRTPCGTRCRSVSSPRPTRQALDAGRGRSTGQAHDRQSSRPGRGQNFFRQWLELDRFETAVKDTTLFPEFTPELKGYRGTRSKRSLGDVFWKGDAKLQTLLTASYSFINEDLAKLYGISGITGTNLRRTELDKGVRRGLLSQVGMLAARANADQTSPVKRGKFVRERCSARACRPPPPT